MECGLHHPHLNPEEMGWALLSSILIQISSLYRPQIKGLDLIRFRVNGISCVSRLIKLIEA